MLASGKRLRLPSLRLSPHSLNVFRQCPRQYRFRYVDNLGDQFRKARPYFTMADHVHAALKDFLSVVPAERRTVETIEKLLERKWRRFRHGFRGREDEQRWAQKALGQVRGFALQHDVRVQPFLLEAWAEAAITPGLVLRGRIDRVDREADGSLHIIDYKTGNRPAVSDLTQLYLYALLLSRRLPLKVSKVSFLYLAQGAMDTAEICQADLDRAAWELLVSASRIRGERLYRPLPGPSCRRCDFTPICTARAGAPAPENTPPLLLLLPPSPWGPAGP